VRCEQPSFWAKGALSALAPHRSFAAPPGEINDKQRKNMKIISFGKNARKFYSFSYSSVMQLLR
jgi:hypothetical protein